MKNGIGHKESQIESEGCESWSLIGWTHSFLIYMSSRSENKASVVKSCSQATEPN